MLKKAIIISMTLGILAACSDNETAEILAIEDQIESISVADLPSSSQSYIAANFQGEIVTDAYKVTGTDNKVSYEAFLSNNSNLVFDNTTSLYGFGDIRSRIEFDTDKLRDQFLGGMNGGSGGEDGHGSGGGMGGNGNGGDGTHTGEGGHGSDGMTGKGGEFRGHPEAVPSEVAIADLPTAITDYITTNYPDNEILKAFSVTWEEKTEYHVLIQEVGALLFDENGNFIRPVRRGKGDMFKDIEEVAIADLPTAVTDYITANYPENEIIRASIVTKSDDTVEIVVAVMEVGLLIFDENGNFKELKTNDMDENHGGSGGHGGNGGGSHGG